MLLDKSRVVLKVGVFSVGYMEGGYMAWGCILAGGRGGMGTWSGHRGGGQYLGKWDDVQCGWITMGDSCFLKFNFL